MCSDERAFDSHSWTDFPREYNDQAMVDPLALFDAPTQHMEDPRPRMSEHLSNEALDADGLVLWLDCDREGENICFEVISITQPVLRPTQLGGHEGGNVFRARFSSLAPEDLCKAMGTLVAPDRAQSLSVDARQLIDLKLGVAFSRFQVRFVRRLVFGA
jgi:DNA topoisomerase III